MFVKESIKRLWYLFISNTKWTQQVIVYFSVYIDIPVTIKEEKAMNLKGGKEGLKGGKYKEWNNNIIF